MTTAAGRRREERRDAVEVEPRLVERHPDDVDAAVLEQVEQRWEARVLDEDEVSGAQQRPRHEVEGVHGAVDDEEVVGGIRPVPRQLAAQLVEHGVVEVAARASPGRSGPRGRARGRAASALSGMPVDRSRLTGGLVPQGPGVALARRERSGPPSCPADRRSGSCPTGRAAATPRSPSSATSSAPRPPAGSGAAGRPAEGGVADRPGTRPGRGPWRSGRRDAPRGRR